MLDATIDTEHELDDTVAVAVTGINWDSGIKADTGSELDAESVTGRKPVAADVKGTTTLKLDGVYLSGGLIVDFA